MGPLANFKVPKGHQTTQTLFWIDEVEKERATKGKAALRANDFEDDLLNQKEIKKVDNHKKNSQVVQVLRRRSLTLSQITGVKDFEKFNQLAVEQRAEAQSLDQRAAASAGETPPLGAAGIGSLEKVQSKSSPPKTIIKPSQITQAPAHGRPEPLQKGPMVGAPRHTATPDMFYSQNSEDAEKKVTKARTTGPSALEDGPSPLSAFSPANEEDDGAESDVILENIDRQGSKIAPKRPKKTSAMTNAIDSKQENYAGQGERSSIEDSGSLPEARQSLVKRSNNFVIQNNSIQFEGENDNIRVSDTLPPNQRDAQASSGNSPVPNKGQNITNIVNNNNINNYIINDPKAIASLMQTDGTQMSSQAVPQQQHSGTAGGNARHGRPQQQGRPSNGNNEAQPSRSYINRRPNVNTPEGGARNHVVNNQRNAAQLYHHNRQGSNVRGVANQINQKAAENIIIYPQDSHAARGKDQQPGNSSISQAITQVSRVMRGGNGQGARSSSHQRKREQQMEQQLDVEKQQMLKVTYGAGVHSLKLNQTQQYTSGPTAFSPPDQKLNISGGPASGPHGQAVGQHGPKISTQIQKEMAKRHESPRSRRQIVGGNLNQTQQISSASINQKFGNFGFEGSAEMNTYLAQREAERKGYGSQQAQTVGKIGNYQMRQNQTQRINFGRNSVGAVGQVAHGRQLLEVGRGFGSASAAAQPTPANQQRLMNRTGPIKIQNQRNPSNLNSSGFNDSLNVSDNQGSIQIGKTIKKISRPGPGYQLGQKQAHGQAWTAHRNSSVKPRGHQPRGNSGSDSNIMRTEGGKQDGGLRPGTAPKQALMNNFAGGSGPTMGSQRLNDRPLSPYSNQNQANHVSYGSNQPKKRATSRRGPSQVISPSNTKAQDQQFANNWMQQQNTQNHRRAQSNQNIGARHASLTQTQKNPMPAGLMNHFYSGQGSSAQAMHGNNFIVTSAGQSGVSPYQRAVSNSRK